MIAHRVETLSYADEIFKISKGEVDLIRRSDMSELTQLLEEPE